MTTADVARKWARIQSRLAEDLQPSVLTDALKKPWGAALAGGLAGVVVGWLLGRRLTVEVITESPETQPAPAAAQPAVPATLVRGALNAGIDALAARLTQRQ